MREVHTDIEINSSPDNVWRILTDFASYDRWNPFIKRVNGLPSEGTKIEIWIERPGGKNRKYSPIITKVKEARELRWFGKSSLPGFLTGEHIFTIEPLHTAQVRLVQRELFRGLLTRLLGKSLETDIVQGFQAMNYALKSQAESRSQEKK
jgi:hypothetical protein